MLRDRHLPLSVRPARITCMALLIATTALTVCMTGCMPASHLGYQELLTTTLIADNQQDTLVASAFGLNQYDSLPETAVASAASID